MLAHDAQRLNDMLLLFKRSLEDLIKAVVHEADEVTDNALLSRDNLRQFEYFFLFYRVSLLQLVVLVNHVHLLLLENSHHMLTF